MRTSARHAGAGLAAVAALAALGLAARGGLPVLGASTTAPPTVPGFSVVSPAERAGLPGRIAIGSVGEGPRRVYVMRSETAHGPQPLIIFFHGYGTATVAGQEPWLTHMAERATVAWPVYDQPPFDARHGARQMFPSAAAGLKSALRRMRANHLVTPGSVIAAGYSLGGALAADYATSARRVGLPEPRALYAVFPGRGLCNGPVRLPPQPGLIGRRTRVLALASPHDLLAGTCGARAILHRAARVPQSRKQLHIVRRFDVGDHFAPTRTGPEEKATFWAPLDRIVAAISPARGADTQAPPRQTANPGPGEKRQQTTQEVPQ